MLEDLNVMVT